MGPTRPLVSEAFDVTRKSAMSTTKKKNTATLKTVPRMSNQAQMMPRWGDCLGARQSRPSGIPGFNLIVFASRAPSNAGFTVPARLPNDRAIELVNAAAGQNKITRLRYKK